MSKYLSNLILRFQEYSTSGTLTMDEFYSKLDLIMRTLEKEGVDTILFADSDVHKLLVEFYLSETKTEKRDLFNEIQGYLMSLVTVSL